MDPWLRVVFAGRPCWGTALVESLGEREVWTHFLRSTLPIVMFTVWWFSTQVERIIRYPSWIWNDYFLWEEVVGRNMLKPFNIFLGVSISICKERPPNHPWLSCAATLNLVTDVPRNRSCRLALWRTKSCRTGCWSVWVVIFFPHRISCFRQRCLPRPQICQIRSSWTRWQLRSKRLRCCLAAMVSSKSQLILKWIFWSQEAFAPSAMIGLFYTFLFLC